MQNSSSNPNSSDEIDLAYFFRWIGRGFARVANGFIFFLATLRNQFHQNHIYFATTIAAGLALGYAYSKFLKTHYYKSTLILNCDYLNPDILKNNIEALNLLAEEKNKQGLANELGIDLKMAQAIIGFESKDFVTEDDVLEIEILREQLNSLTTDKQDVVDKVINKLTIHNKNSYMISVRLLDPKFFEPLEAGLINYFNNSSYIKRRIEINHQSLKSRREKLTLESRKLDSLKSALYTSLMNVKSNRGSNNVILNDDLLNNPIEIFREDLDINSQILQIERSLYLQADFELIQGFTVVNEPESPKLPTILFYSFLISLIVGYVVLATLKFDRYLATLSAAQT